MHIYLNAQGSRQKTSFSVARPLRGEGAGGKGLATKKKITFFEALIKNPKKNVVTKLEGP